MRRVGVGMQEMDDEGFAAGGEQPATAARTAASSSGVRTLPEASTRSETSSRRSRGMTGRKTPVIP